MKRTLAYTLSLLGLLFFLIALPIYAQEAEEEEESDLSVDTTAAVWGSYADKDSSKAEEYGEIPEGFLINHFRAGLSMKEDRFLEIRGQNVGLNSQQYSFAYGVDGKYSLDIGYTSIPHLFSKSAATIWTETSPGIWRIADSVQRAIQNLNDVPPTDPTAAAGRLAQVAFVSNLLREAHPVELYLQRNRGSVGFTYTPNLTWTYGLSWFKENRDGTRPFGTSFGFSWVTELPERIDYDTERLHAGVEYNNNGTSLAVAYDLSLFMNENEVMIWDNPLRITDRTYESAYSPGDGTSQARVQLPSDNSANMFSFAGAKNFGSSRLSGSFAYSIWTDEVDLLPFTINTAIEPIPLPADTYNGDISNLNFNLRYATPIGSRGNFTANWRWYDMENNGDQFRIGEYVRFDQVEEELHRFECDRATGTCVQISDPPTPLFGYSTNTVDLNFSWPLTSRLNWDIGYMFNRTDREEREVEQSDTNQFRTGIIASATEWLSLRFSYLFSAREFDDLREHNPTYLVIPMRRFDVANRDRNQFRFSADLVPAEAYGFSLVANWMRDEYPDSEFGLLEGETFTIGGDFTYTFGANTLNLFYDHTEWTTDQRGRQSGATPSTDPRADWSANLENKFDTIGLGFSRDFSEHKANWNTTISYALANGDVNLDSPPGGTPDVARSLDNMDETDLLVFRTGFNFRLFPRARLGLLYWFENYNIDDFGEDTTIRDLTRAGSILLGAVQPDYRYHNGWVGLSYSW